MNEVYYYYTLAPCSCEVPHYENLSEIDLNISADYRIIFAGINDGQAYNSRDSQLKRFEFVKNNSDVMNITAHFLSEIKKAADYNSYDIESSAMYEAVQNGEYGEYPIDFFNQEKYCHAQEIIIYYLIQKKYNNKRTDYFQCALTDIFLCRVTYYFDSLKKILYISFISPETPENRLIFDICRYLFADLLMNIEVRWNSYPLIINETSYAVAGEGEQSCGTII